MTVYRSFLKSARNRPVAAALFTASLASLLPVSYGATFDKVVMARNSVTVGGKKVHFGSFEAAAMNDKGQVSFYSVIYGAGVNVTNNNAIFTRKNKRTTLIARENVATEIAGQTVTLTPLTTNFLINAGNRTLWSGDTNGNTNYYISTKGGAASPLVTITGTTAGNEPVADFNSKNAISVLALNLSLSTSPLTVFRISATQISSVVSAGSPAVGMPFGSTFQSFGNPSIDNKNTVYYTASISGKGSKYDGIWQGKGADPKPIVVIGRNAPGVSGDFTAFTGSPAPSPNGKYCAFGADASTKSGIWLSTPATGGIRKIAAEGQKVSTENGSVTLKTFDEPAVNNTGHVAFLARAKTSAGTKSVLFLSESAGGELKKVVGQGDTVLIGGKSLKINDILFKPRGGLNKKGKLLVTLAFTDRTSGIFIVTP